MITDPLFYVIAIPAVLILGISKSGFGGALGGVTVPMLALVVTVPEAAAITLPVLLVMDLIGIGAYRRDFDRANMHIILPAGVLGIAIGYLTFKLVDPKWLAGLIGAISIAFVFHRWWQARHKNTGQPAQQPSIIRGGFWAGVSGFTSFVSHSGGPPIAMYLVPQRLSPQVYVATATLFFATINFCKWLPYWWLGLIDTRNMSTSLALIAFAPLGNWLGIRIARRIEPTLFYRVVSVALLATGAKLLWDAFR